LRSLRQTRILFLSLLLSSCLGTKYLEPGERILKKQKIKGARRFDQSEVYGLFEQSPNSRFFFLPIALEVHLYEWGKSGYDSAKYRRKVRKIRNKYQRKLSKTEKDNKRTRLISTRDKKIAKWTRKTKEGNWRMRQGEPLAVFDSSAHERTREKYNQYLASEGYFEGDTNLKTTLKGKKQANTFYQLRPNDRYFIDSLEYYISDKNIAELVNNNTKNALEKRDAYSEENLRKERNRLYEILLDNGYYYFSKQYIFFEVDTFSLVKPRVLLKVRINEPPEGQHQQYRVDSVSFIGEGHAYETSKDSIEYEGVTYLFGRNRYNQELLSNRLFINKGELYSQRNALETQRQLGNLDAFKFVNINYDSTGGKFKAAIFTSPVDKYQTSNEVGLSSTAGLPGPFVNISLQNRNAFRRLELLEISGNLNLQGINSISDEERNYSLLQYGGIASITFPQFLFPLSNRLNERVSRYNPRTNVSLSYSFEDRFEEYERQIFTGTFSYQWQVRNNFNYTLTPLGLSLVDSKIEAESSFDSLLITLRENGNGSFPASFESALLTVSSIDAIINNNYGNRSENTSFLRLFIESGGNLLNFLNESIFNFDNVRYQFLKFGADYRRQTYIDRNTVLASRINFGIALPYGRDEALPYERYFYIGGSNSIRAWPARRLGPGGFAIYQNETDTGLREISYTLEQGGDMIIETSLELRRRITDFLSWAYFIDAGNIWQIRSTPLFFEDRPNSGPENANFRFNSFLQEMAVGTGVGLRIDFGYLVLRADWAVQVLDPGQEIGRRFVLDNIDFFSAFQRVDDPESDEGIDLQNRKDFLGNKTRLNIGIGFPF